jgi:4'-phosphopantetheinyl transferase EntD
MFLPGALFMSMIFPCSITKEIMVGLRDCFGHGAGISVRRIDGTCPYLPEEAAWIESAPKGRREEFLTGRWCAQQALRQLGLQPSPVGVGPQHQPLWPPGIVGSITHAAGIATVVVARAGNCIGIGIDLLENADATRALRDAAGLIASEDEEEEARVAASGLVDARALVFSVKESAIKAISPTLRRFLDFREIDVRFPADRFDLSNSSATRSVWVRWQIVSGELILCASTFDRRFRLMPFGEGRSSTSGVALAGLLTSNALSERFESALP